MKLWRLLLIWLLLLLAASPFTGDLPVRWGVAASLAALLAAGLAETAWSRRRVGGGDGPSTG